MPRYLIVNADDFGLSPGVNRGIIECAERGILTSASLMVRWPAAAEAAAYGNHNRNISIGLHVDLGEWILRNGKWELLYKVVDAEDKKAVETEITHQLAEFRRLVGHDPSHLDSHQHVHRSEPAHSIMLNLAQELGVSLRECDPRIRYCGDFYGQGAEGEHLPDAITVANLKQILTSLPDGVTELGCHPGCDDGLQTPYRSERTEEVRVLCNPAIQECLKPLQVELRSFDALPQSLRAPAIFSCGSFR
jgi:chitin disaccharide deacetylase